MEPLNIAIEGLSLDTVVGERYVHGGEEPHSTPMTLADAIVDTAARALTSSSEYQSLRDRVRKIRDEEIRQRVAAQIEAALVDEFDLTNQYGERTGKRTTLREQIVRIATEAMRMDVRNAWSRDQLMPAERVIREEVERVFAKELAEVVTAEKEKVVAAVRAKAAELIADAVKQGIGR